MRFSLGLSFLALAATSPAVKNPAGVAADLLAELVRNSPFLPAGGATAGGDAARGELELRGVVWDGGAYRFSIFDPSSGESVWARLDERGFPFLARSFDRERDVLTVEFNGRILVLPLAESELGETPGGDPGSAPPPPPLPTPVENQARPAGAPADQPPPAPGTSALGAEEAQRFQQMADETRRRRGVGPPPEPPKN